jgi:hypothetical protein
LAIKPQSWSKPRFAKIEKFYYFQNKIDLRAKIKKKSLLFWSLAHCGYFEPIPDQFGLP